MTRNIFGWDYPPGAEHDPRAPYNQKEPECPKCGGTEEEAGCCIYCGYDMLQDDDGGDPDPTFDADRDDRLNHQDD